MDRLTAMQVLVRVVETGSFTAVANENNVTAAQISRAVTTLEQQLQTVVLHRTTRSVTLTSRRSTQRHNGLRTQPARRSAS